MYNINQIWMSGTPSSVIIKYMESIIDAKGPNDTYTLVADNNFLVHKDGVIFQPIADIVSAMQTAYPLIKTFWDTLVVEHKSDLVRYYLASMTDFMLYLDCDCEATRLPAPISAYPHFVKYTLSGCVVKEYIFFNNSQFGFFKILFQRLVDFMSSPAFQGFYGAPFIILNKQLNIQNQKFSMFADDAVAHHTL